MSDTTSEKQHYWNSDRPISKISEDKLERSNFAQQIAKDLAAWNNPVSLVIALNGDWASGKTSVKNLILEELETHDESPVVAEFNPWLVSGEESITQAFFNEITVKLKAIEGGADTEDRVKTWRKYAYYAGLGSKLSSAVKVAGYFVPGLAVVGDVSEKALGKIEELSNTAVEALEADEVSLTDLKDQLREQFKKLSNPLLVVIDDIDRLTDREIRLVVQLIKSNADLPNVIYLLLYQRDTVATALEQLSGGKGNLFLKKIVQVDIEIPKAPERLLKQFYFDNIYPAFGSAKTIWDKHRLEDVFDRIIWPLIKTPRDILRIRCSLEFYITSLTKNGWLDVNPIDLLLLEFLRHFSPDAYEVTTGAFKERRDVLLGLYFGDISRSSHFQDTVNGFIEKLQIQDAEKQIIVKILNELFPQLNDPKGYVSDSMSDWDREMRVCHPRHFHKYFQLAPNPDNIELSLISEIINPDNDLESTTELIREKIDKTECFEALLDRLKSIRHEIPKSTIKKISLALLALSDGLPEYPHKHFRSGDGARGLVNAIASFLWSLDSQVDREQLFTEIINETESLTGTARLYWICEPGKERGVKAQSFVSDEILDSVKKTVTDRLKRGVLRPSFFRLDISGYVFGKLGILMGESFDEYISPTIKDFDPTQSLQFLTARLGISQVTSTTDSADIYYLKPKDISRFMPLQEFIARLPAEGETDFDSALLKYMRDLFPEGSDDESDKAIYLFSERKGVYDRNEEDQRY